MKEYARFLYEVGNLKNTERKGWRRLGIRHPESVAEHSLRTAYIAYILAFEEGLNPEQCVTMAIIHDVGEARVGDRDKIQAGYLTKDEKRAVADQTQGLGDVGKSIVSYWQEVEDTSTAEGTLVKDADYLEAMFSAKEYMDQGYTMAERWLNNEKKLQTKSAQKLATALKSMNAHEWWNGLTSSQST